MSDDSRNASKTIIRRVTSVTEIEPTACTVETQAHRKPPINRIPALSTTRSGGSSRKITANPRAGPSTPQRYCHGNNALCETPWLSALYFLSCGVCVERRGDLEPPTHRSSLGATRAYVQSALLSRRLGSSWTYRDPSLRHFGRDTSLTVENSMAQSRQCLDPRTGLALGGSLIGLFGLDGAS